MKNLYLFLSLILAHNSYGLVDYSDGEDAQVSKMPHSIVRRNAPKKTKNRNRKNSFNPISLGVQYDTLDVSSGQESGKVERLMYKGHIQTRYGIFVDASYWNAKSDTESLNGDDNSLQAGNPEINVGLNWMRFGKGPEATTIDISGGVIIGSKSSPFATSRTDKLVNVTTKKKISNFVLGLGLEYRLTGTPKRADELDIGNVRTLEFGLGWIVSDQIKFIIEADATKVSASDNQDGLAKLNESLSFTSLSPKVILSISPNLDMQLGTTIRTRKTSASQNLINARLYDMNGSYGNSIYIGLGASI